LDELVHAIDLSPAGARTGGGARVRQAIASEQLVVKIVLIQGNYCLLLSFYVTPWRPVLETRMNVAAQQRAGLR
jgi:hypothetical protein